MLEPRSSRSDKRGGRFVMGVLLSLFLAPSSMAQLRLSEIEAYEEMSQGGGNYNGESVIYVLLAIFVFLLPMIIASKKVGKYGSGEEYAMVFLKWFFPILLAFLGVLVVLRQV